MQPLHSPWRHLFPGIQHLGETGQVWLDSAATTQKPQAMLDALLQHYQQGVANVHRAQHQPGERATLAFEQARQQATHWLNAPSSDCIIFTKGTTEGLNLLSHALAGQFKVGDEILLSGYEHHANLLPWQQLAQRQELQLKILPVDNHGTIELAHAAAYFNSRTRLLAISPLSNVLGQQHCLDALLAQARAQSILTVVDGAQSAVHSRPDVQQLGCDFFVCSSHKLYGPDGVGVLYAQPEQHALMQPWQWGGEMIEHCTYQTAQARALPLGFEAGTPSIANVIAFAATLKWLLSLDSTAVQAHEQALFQRLHSGLRARNMHIIGQPDTALISFNAPSIHPADLAQLLSEQGIAVRGGQHCAMPLFQQLGLPGAVRVSLALYNDSSDLQAFFQALDNALELLA